MAVTALPCRVVGAKGEEPSAVLLMWSHDNEALREMSAGSKPLRSQAFFSSFPLSVAHPPRCCQARTEQRVLHITSRGGGTELCVSARCASRRASHFLCSPATASAHLRSVSLPCSLQHRLSAQRLLLLLGGSEGRESVFWCPEGHTDKAMSFKYRSFGKRLHFRPSCWLSLGNYFGQAQEVLAVFSTNENLQP